MSLVGGVRHQSRYLNWYVGKEYPYIHPLSLDWRSSLELPSVPSPRCCGPSRSSGTQPHSVSSKNEPPRSHHSHEIHELNKPLSIFVSHLHSEYWKSISYQKKKAY